MIPCHTQKKQDASLRPAWWLVVAVFKLIGNQLVLLSVPIGTYSEVASCWNLSRSRVYFFMK
jgi:hypothetical protein